MTVTELGMCHYFAAVGNTMAYSREDEVSRIPSNSPQIVGAIHYRKRIIFWMDRGSVHSAYYCCIVPKPLILIHNFGKEISGYKVTKNEKIRIILTWI